MAAWHCRATVYRFLYSYYLTWSGTDNESCDIAFGRLMYKAFHQYLALEAVAAVRQEAKDLQAASKQCMTKKGCSCGSQCA